MPCLVQFADMSGERETLLVEPVARADGDLVSITRESHGSVALNIGIYSITYTNEMIARLGRGDFYQGLLKVGQFGLEVAKKELSRGGYLFPNID